MKRLWILWLIALAVSEPAFADCDDPDNPSESDDCDEDGFTVGDGDCDDDDPDQNPGADEICDDAIDNNCDGEADEGCGTPIGEGELLGGSSCGQSGGGLAWLAPLMLFGGRRRWS